MKLPYIFNVINKEQFQSMLEAFYECIELPIQVIDAHGKQIETYGNVNRFCSLLRNEKITSDSCMQMPIKASKRAVTLGESYIFSCHANLNNIVFPLISNNCFLGSIIVGPFLMLPPDSLFIQDISKKYDFSTDILFELYEEATKIKIVEPHKVTHISHLLFFLFINLISDCKQQLAHNQEKLHQQAKINEAIQMFKSTEIEKTSIYPYDKEKKLIQKVKEGNSSDAKALLNDLLGYVLFSEGSSLDSVKARAFELCTLLSRAAIEGGAASDNILKLNNQFIKNFQNINNTDALCLTLQEMVEVFTESMFYYIPPKNYKIMKKALLYIKENYTKNITLEDVSSQVNLNPAYFSSLFKQSFDSSFKDYLNTLKIEESKRLLSNTDYSIIDIAVATGFSDQSYFSKTFKKYTGLSPKQYKEQFHIQ